MYRDEIGGRDRYREVLTAGALSGSRFQSTIA
jgi:hypothetical protein